MLSKSIIIAIVLATTAGLGSSAFAQTRTHRHTVYERNGLHSFATVPAYPGIYNSWPADPTGDMGAYNPGDY
jgi:hypothetical protein